MMQDNYFEYEQLRLNLPDDKANHEAGCAIRLDPSKSELTFLSCEGEKRGGGGPEDNVDDCVDDDVVFCADAICEEIAAATEGHKKKKRRRKAKNGEERSSGMSLCPDEYADKLDPDVVLLSNLCKWRGSRSALAAHRNSCDVHVCCLFLHNRCDKYEHRLCKMQSTCERRVRDAENQSDARVAAIRIQVAAKEKQFKQTTRRKPPKKPTILPGESPRQPTKQPQQGNAVANHASVTEGQSSTFGEEPDLIPSEKADKTSG
eukprot:Rmarinus@m.7142